MATGSMPVLVGAGQYTNHWDAGAGAATAPSPRDLAVEASRRALSDAGIDGAEIDTLAVARLTVESGGRPHYPFGRNDNLPGTIARELGLTPRSAIYASAGGQSSQQMVNELAARICAGESELVLFTGSEANRTLKAATRAGLELNWADTADLEFEDRGPGPRLLNRTEVKHGLVLPAYFYGLFENALAHEWGETRSQHRATMAALFEKFAAVAAHHPDAQFEAGFDARFLATPSKENYPFADPFLKWFMAQDNVNQAAAVVMMSEAKADALSIAPDRRVYLHGMGEASDDMISERPHLDRSWAMKVALSRAFEQAELTSSDIDLFDLYSCFPCAVFASMRELGIDHRQETRPLTLTGGLPYFGGPGNNYSLHAIVAMADALRAAPGKTGLVLANGGWLTKEAVAIWSTERPHQFTPAAPAATPTTQVALEEAPTTGQLESFTVTHGRNGPEKGIVFARTAEGKRFLANAGPAALSRLCEEISPIGASIQASSAEEINTFEFT
ncbi:MAG: acetyl-CoA acetyltransferase [Pseudomonadota bacterium]